VEWLKFDLRAYAVAEEFLKLDCRGPIGAALRSVRVAKIEKKPVRCVSPTRVSRSTRVACLSAFAGPAFVEMVAIARGEFRCQGLDAHGGWLEEDPLPDPLSIGVGIQLRSVQRGNHAEPAHAHWSC
jgi:hypothetical protein